MIGLVIDFDSHVQKPKYVVIYEYFKDEIHEGRLKSGDKLPSIRQVSQTLKISKSTVENAYNQLVVEGYVESRLKSGYFVMPIDLYTPALAQHDAFEVPLPEKGAEIVESTAFNFDEWKKVSNKVIEYDFELLLSQGDSQGEWLLRQEIATFIHQYRGCICSPHQIVIGAGIQYLFGLLAAMFRHQVDEIAFEYPGFSKGMYIFEDYGYETLKIPVEEDGISVTKLSESHANIVYVSPSHQYPTGSIMSIQKRNQLLKWAEARYGYIIEDDYDSILRYEGYPIPALQGLGGGNRVIYMGSFSKLVIPSLRISFMVLPESLLKPYHVIKERYSQTVSKLEQLTLAHYMMEGYFERHLRRIKKSYGRKNQLLIDAFRQYESDKVKLIGKASGLHVMLQFDASVDIDRLIDEASLNHIKIEKVSPLDNSPIVVLSYSGIRDSDINQAVNLIMNMLF